MVELSESRSALVKTDIGKNNVSFFKGLIKDQ